MAIMVMVIAIVVVMVMGFGGAMEHDGIYFATAAFSTH
jgi:hypothetical protein